MSPLVAQVTEAEERSDVFAQIFDIGSLTKRGPLKGLDTRRAFHSTSFFFVRAEDSSLAADLTSEELTENSHGHRLCPNYGLLPKAHRIDDRKQ